MERKVVYLQMPAIWTMGDSHLKAHLLEDGDSCHKAHHVHLPVEAEVFYKEGEGNRTTRLREGAAKFFTCR